ncbi:hypothetical protein BL253_05405 [Pseudofrankia asymbiotica]|uniref:Uncharacterized protein n=2 Tax=Pseudofrankia asymbiotica TaxID=1834516 RepID=A0A1V2IHJ0_9ACTN|nr:hypothetical protein BL253_05405 [Pseudofrankia asymbiotica]
MPTVLAALPLVLVLALTGCGAGDGSATVASAAGAGSGGAAGTNGGATATGTPRPGDLAVKFAQCMRENGVDMPDPVDGRIELRVDPSTPKETVDAAMEACREYSPQANGSAGSDPEMEAKAREFAACMRKNGVEAFPDPEPGQRGIMIGPEVGDDPDFQTAQQACDGILAGKG